MLMIGTVTEKDNRVKDQGHHPVIVITLIMRTDPITNDRIPIEDITEIITTIVRWTVLLAVTEVTVVPMVVIAVTAADTKISVTIMVIFTVLHMATMAVAMAAIPTMDNTVDEIQGLVADTITIFQTAVVAISLVANAEAGRIMQIVYPTTSLI